MSTPSQDTGQIRLERDRFVAFAFAAADALIEVDSNHVIVYAAGATKTLFNTNDNGLLGRRLFDCFAGEDRERLRAAVDAMPAGSRMAPVAVRLQGATRPPVTVGGYRMPHLDGHCCLALSFVKRAAEPPPPASRDRDPATGLLDKTAFGEAIGDRLQTGEDYDLTLIDLGAFDSLCQRVDAEASERTLVSISESLRAISVDGDSAGRLDDSKFGVLHERHVDCDTLRSRIEGVTKRIDPKGVGVSVRAATVNLDDRSAMTPQDIANAVMYTINTFCKREGDAFNIHSLSRGCEAMVRETASRIADFKRTISAGRFKIAVQPIVNLMTGEVHHYEALTRFDDDGKGVSPQARIAFAEEAGVISGFDLTMARRAIDLLVRADLNRKKLVLAVNVSGQSLGSPSFVNSLLGVLGRNRSIRRRLWFEITESAKIKDLEATNDVIQTLRKAGHAVCLDDFGTGATAYQYLRALDVDVVKIDGVYVREALTTPQGKTFLKSMASLCRELNVDVVAEMIEDEKTAAFVRQCGIRYGQGYLFGKPMLVEDIDLTGDDRGTQSTAASRPARSKAA